jgi:hypothetical protein
MVAIDEISAQRANLKSATDDRFGVLRPTFLVDAARNRNDLLYDPENPAGGSDSLEKRLIDARINYRIFSSAVYLRGAKWSKAQTK